MLLRDRKYSFGVHHVCNAIDHREFEKYKGGMATFAEDQVARLETLLAKAVGVDSVTVDGQSVKYTNLIEQYDYWKARVANESGSRPVSISVDLGNF